MPEQNSRDFEPKTERRVEAQPRGDGLVTQRLALLAVFAVAVIAVLTFAYVL